MQQQSLQQLTPQQIPLFIESIANANSNFDIIEYCKGIQSIFIQHPQFTPQVLSVLQNHPFKEIPAVLMSCSEDHISSCISLMIHWIKTSKNIQIVSKSFGYLGFKSKGKSIPDLYQYIQPWLPTYTRELLMPIKQLLANGVLNSHFKDIFLIMDPTYYSQYGDLILTKKNEIPPDHMSVILQIYMKHTAQFQGKRSTLCMLLKTILHTLDKASDVKMVQQLHVFFTMKLHTLFKMYANQEIQMTPKLAELLKANNIEYDAIVDPLVGTLYVCDEELDADELIIAFRIVSMGIKQTTASLIVQNQQRANNPQVPDPITVELYDWIKQSADCLLKMSAIAYYQERFGVSLKQTEEEWITKVIANGAKRTPFDIPETLNTNWKTHSLQIEQEVVETLLTTFTSIPATMISSVLPRPELLMRSCKFHSIRLGFIQSLLSNNAIASPLALHFFKYFHSSLAKLTSLDPVLLKIYMRVAKLTFLTFAINPSHIVTLQYEMTEFTRDVVKFYIKSGNTCYLMLIKHLFRSIGNAPKDENYAILEPCIHDLFTAIHSGLSIPKHALLCTEILLTLPAKLSFLIDYLPSMKLPIILALKAPFYQMSAEYDEPISNVTTQALKTLDLCLDHLEFDVLMTMLSNAAVEIHQLIRRITMCTDTDVIDEALNDLGLKVICKLFTRCDGFMGNDYSIQASKLIDNHESVDILLKTDTTSSTYDYAPVLEHYIAECKQFKVDCSESVDIPISGDLKAAIEVSLELVKHTTSEYAFTLVFYGVSLGLVEFKQFNISSSTAVINAYITSLNIATTKSIQQLSQSSLYVPICTQLCLILGDLEYTALLNALVILNDFLINNKDTIDITQCCKQLILALQQYSICSTPLNAHIKSILQQILPINNIELNNFIVARAFTKHYIQVDSYLSFISTFKLDFTNVPFIQELLQIPLKALALPFQIAYLKNIAWYLSFTSIDPPIIQHLLSAILSVLASIKNPNYHYALRYAAVQCLFSISRIKTYHGFLIKKELLVFSINLIFDHDHTLAYMAFEQLKLIRSHVLENDAATRPFIKEALKPQMTFTNKNASHSSSGGIAKVIELFPQNTVKVDYSNTIFMVLEKVFNQQPASLIYIERELGIMDSSFDAILRCQLDDPKHCISLMIQYYQTLSHRSNQKHLQVLSKLNAMFHKNPQLMADKLVDSIDNIVDVDIILYTICYSQVNKDPIILQLFMEQKLVQIKEIINDFHSLKMYNFTKILHAIHFMGLEHPQFTVCHLQSIGCLLKQTQKPNNFLVYYSEIVNLYGSFTSSIIKKMFNRLPDTCHLLFNDDCADFNTCLLGINKLTIDQNTGDLVIRFLQLPNKGNSAHLRLYFDLFLYPIFMKKPQSSPQLIAMCKSVIWESNLLDIDMNILYCWLKITQVLIKHSHHDLSSTGTSKHVIKFAFLLIKKEDDYFKLKGEAGLTCALCITYYDIPDKYTITIFGQMLKSFQIMECVDVLHEAMAYMCDYFVTKLDKPLDYLKEIIKCLQSETTPHVIVNIYKLIITHPILFKPHLTQLNLLLINPLHKMINLVGIELRTIVIDLFVFLCQSLLDYSNTDILATTCLKFMHAIGTSTAVKRFYWLDKLSSNLELLLTRAAIPLIQLQDIPSLLDQSNVQPLALPSYTLFIDHLMQLLIIDINHRSKSWTQQSHANVSTILDSICYASFTNYPTIHSLLKSILNSTQHFSNSDLEEAGDFLNKHLSSIAHTISSNPQYNKYIIILICNVLLDFKKELVDPFIPFLMNEFINTHLPFPQLLFLSTLLFKCSNLLVHYKLEFTNAFIQHIKVPRTYTHISSLFNLVISKYTNTFINIPLILKSFKIHLHPKFIIDYYEFIFQLYLNHNTQYTTLLEPIFMSAFSCPNFSIKLKFMSLYNLNIKKDPFSRLYYMTSKQNWNGMVDDMGGHLIWSYFECGRVFLKLELPDAIKSTLLNLATPPKYNLLYHVLPQLQFTKIQKNELQYAFTQLLVNGCPTVTNTVLNTLHKLRIKIPPYLASHLNGLLYLEEYLNIPLFNNAYKQCLLMNNDMDLLPMTINSSNKHAHAIIHDLQGMDYASAQSKIEANIGNEFYKSVWLICSKALQQWELLMEISKHEQWHALHLESKLNLLDFNNPSELQLFDGPLEWGSDVKTLAYQSVYLLFTKGTPTPTGTNNKLNDMIRCKIHNNTLTINESRLYLETCSIHAVNASLNKIVDVNTAIQESTQLEQQCHYYRQFIPSKSSSVVEWTEFIKIRKYAFDLINNVMANYIPNMQSMLNTNGQQSLAFKGFHELAWSYNKLAQVYRRHGLLPQCVQVLNNVYALPNIEIQEAFIKLREQAKLYGSDVDLCGNGLELIKTTNTHYFNNLNKSEFLIFKAKYLVNAVKMEEANEAYMNATQTNKEFYKAWSQWGRFHIKHLDMEQGTILENAITCLINGLSCVQDKINFKDGTQLIWLLSTNTDIVPRDYEYLQMKHLIHVIPEVFYLCASIKEFANFVITQIFGQSPNLVFTWFIEHPDHPLLGKLKGMHPVLFGVLDKVYKSFIDIGDREMEIEAFAYLKVNSEIVALPDILSNYGYATFSTVPLPCQDKMEIMNIHKFVSLRRKHDYHVITVIDDNGNSLKYKIYRCNDEYPLFRTSQGYWNWNKHFTNKSLEFVCKRVELPIINKTWLKNKIVISQDSPMLYTSEFASELVEERTFEASIEKYENSVKDALLGVLDGQVYWDMRKTFTYTYAMLNGTIFALDLEMMTLKEFGINMENGTCMGLGNVFGNKRNGVDKDEPHFRLTPTLQAFIGSIGIQGYFRQMLICYGKALIDKHSYLRLFLPVAEPQEESEKINGRFVFLTRGKIDDLISASTNPKMLEKLEKKYVGYY